MCISNPKDKRNEGRKRTRKYENNREGSKVRKEESITQKNRRKGKKRQELNHHGHTSPPHSPCAHLPTKASHPHYPPSPVDVLGNIISPSRSTPMPFALTEVNDDVDGHPHRVLLAAATAPSNDLLLARLFTFDDDPGPDPYPLSSKLD